MTADTKIRRALYSRCITCSMTDAPGAGMCMDCYMRGQPHRMIDIYEVETKEEVQK